MKRTTNNKPLSQQMKERSKEIPLKKEYDGNTEIMISTGSTLLDLAISGERKRGGGIPAGILLEVFGPEGSGKTVLLCEIGGAIQRAGGDLLFNDPEARLNTTFAERFDLNTSELDIREPDTVTEMISGVQKWKPKTDGKVHGIMADSLAALSTNMEMDNEDGDKMGMRRAKEFSEGLRKVCRILKQNNYIMACSNQIRVNMDTTSRETITTPGGRAVAFYASIRLRLFKPEKVKSKKIKIGRKEIDSVLGTKVRVEVYKNSVAMPYKTAEVYIMDNYGIDDIRANLQYLKDYTGSNTYSFNNIPLGVSIDKAIQVVESEKLERKIRRAVIDLWEEVNSKFKVDRKKKVR